MTRCLLDPKLNFRTLKLQRYLSEERDSISNRNVRLQQRADRTLCNSIARRSRSRTMECIRLSKRFNGVTGTFGVLIMIKIKIHLNTC